MDYSPKGTIRLHMEQMTNDELRDIWVENRRDEYTAKTFTVIHDLLLERGIDIPLQSEFIGFTEEANNNMTLGGFFSFQFMISSMLVEIIYALGAIGITVGSLFLMRERFPIGFLSLIVGNLVWRLVCETAIIFFRINEQLGLIHYDLKRVIK